MSNKMVYKQTDLYEAICKPNLISMLPDSPDVHRIQGIAQQSGTLLGIQH